MTLDINLFHRLMDKHACAVKEMIVRKMGTIVKLAKGGVIECPICNLVQVDLVSSFLKC